MPMAELGADALNKAYQDEIARAFGVLVENLVSGMSENEASALFGKAVALVRRAYDIAPIADS